MTTMSLFSPGCSILHDGGMFRTNLSLKQCLFQDICWTNDTQRYMCWEKGVLCRAVTVTHLVKGCHALFARRQYFPSPEAIKRSARPPFHTNSKITLTSALINLLRMPRRVERESNKSFESNETTNGMSACKMSRESEWWLRLYL